MGPGRLHGTQWALGATNPPGLQQGVVSDEAWAAGATRSARATGGGVGFAYPASPPAETLRYGPRMELRLDSAAAWLLEQSERFLATGFVPAGAGHARLGRHAYRSCGPDRWSVAARQAQAGDCEIAIRFGASATAPLSPSSGPADSQAREHARWTCGIV